MARVSAGSIGDHVALYVLDALRRLEQPLHVTFHDGAVTRVDYPDSKSPRLRVIVDVAYDQEMH